MIKVYIASPYTLGNKLENVKRQMECGNILIECGYAPFIPLLTHFQHSEYPQDYETWLKLDFEWIKSCDCLLRLDGESPGADKEVEYAKSLGIPVYYSINKLIKGE